MAAICGTAIAVLTTCGGGGDSGGGSKGSGNPSPNVVLLTPSSLGQESPVMTVKVVAALLYSSLTSLHFR